MPGTRDLSLIESCFKFSKWHFLLTLRGAKLTQDPEIESSRPPPQCLRRGTFSLIFNSFKNVYFQLVRLIEGILHIV